MQITPFHAKFYAHDLTRRCASDSVEKLAAVLADAQVDLNPHQVEAALFAFRSPFSRGAILADEVGLGKTIEAGLLLAQKWAERRRRLLVIAPANLRKQWAQEMADKFYLPTLILENRNFNEFVRGGNFNPFQQPAIVICSFQFARKMDAYVRRTPWDLVVIDEAHRLRNVYKTSSKIANAIKDAVAPFPKVLLTATPLQNSLLELYGLVSIIDDYAFGDFKAYRARFARLGNDGDFQELKERLRPICKRTLRKQVLEYVKYTNRHALVQEFVPSDDEQRLYDLVTDYLQRPALYALPAGQRQLMTLILRKLLASSTYAITQTLEGLARKLERTIGQASADAELPEGLPDGLPEGLAGNWENLEELVDEWEEDEGGETGGEGDEAARYTPAQLEEIRAELAQLAEFHDLARSIVKNSKGEVLLTALRRGFAAAAQAQAGGGAARLQQKAIIFTESRRTQEYLLRILEQTEFGGKVVLFNGANSDPLSKQIYRRWLERHAGSDRISGSPSADMRAALVDCFRDEAQIMIATEAAAEGINLQFCNLVVNYDLPWNPQRIEQRIGRCHRYGQKYDVVVVNFLNKQNAADERVYELLAEKFRLFDGVFGASDEVLGAVEAGVDFEKRIAAIYQRCRTPEQIQYEFDQLQRELESEIAAGQADAREKLLNNFDQEVVEKVRVQSHDFLDHFNERLWLLTRHLLAPHATFADTDHSFLLLRNPYSQNGDGSIHPGRYRMGRDVEGAHTYRVGHPLAQAVLAQGKELAVAPAAVTFTYTGSGKQIAALAPLVGKGGWLGCWSLRLSALEPEDHVVFAGVDDSGAPVGEVECRRLFDLPGTPGFPEAGLPGSVEAQLQAQAAQRREGLLAELDTRNGSWFDAEMGKLEKWADDRRASLKGELDDLDAAIKEAKKAARQAPNLPARLELQRELRKLERERDDAWRSYDGASREIERQKDELLDQISRRLEQSSTITPLFLLRWQLT